MLLAAGCKSANTWHKDDGDQRAGQSARVQTLSAAWQLLFVLYLETQTSHAHVTVVCSGGDPSFTEL